MGRVKTTERVIAEVLSACVITESEVLLLKRRSNAQGCSTWDYGYNGVTVTREQGVKGLEWLRKQARRRKHNPFTPYERELIAESSPTDFQFMGFMNASDYGLPWFEPVYKLNGLEYYVHGGDIVIL